MLPTSILLFHGSRDGYRPSDKTTVIPFSDSELLAQGFTYAAIGHYHSLAQIRADDGSVRAAYSGCLQGRGLDESGRKFAILGEIGPDGLLELEETEVAVRRIINMDVAVTGAVDNATVLDRIDRALSESNTRDCDLVNVSLSGTLPLSVTLDMSRLESARRFFHMRVDSSRILPCYDLDALSRESTASPLKSAFVRRILKMQECSSEHDCQVLQDAIYHGLLALDGRKPEPRDAH